MAERLDNITNQIQDKLRRWPSHMPPPQVAIVHENYLPDAFDPDLETIEGLKVVTTLQIRKTSVRLAFLHEQL